jgi:XTP/dITP diphosphohydrolase
MFVTGNKGKMNEVAALFSQKGHAVEQLDEDCPEMQADTLEEVVEAALAWLWERHRASMMIDDSGLFVKNLKGFPGVYSAYAYKTLGCPGLIKLMNGVNDRAAEFRCCAGFVDSGGNITMRTGACPGQLIGDMRGSGGFGFDPIFMPEGYYKTFAELPLDEKNRISHRGKAFAMLADALKEG